MSKSEPDIKQAVSIDISEDGIAATHPIAVDFPKPVATSQPSPKTHNTLKDFLIVVGCSLVPDFHFAFDSSFPGPAISGATKKLAALREALKDFEGLKTGEPKSFPPLSVFGHADPTGKRGYNSKLSQRRAAAVYAMLIRDVNIWEEIFQDRSLPGDVWGDEEIGQMLDTVGLEPEFPLGSEDPNGRKAALKRAEDRGARGKQARAVLFRAYMDKVCVQEKEGREVELELKKEDFLARGENKDVKGDVQGCGEFNPVLIESQEEIDRVEKTPDSSPEKEVLKAVRDAVNEPNRRVIIFLFKPGSKIVPKKWPCPDHNRSQQESVAACQSRFWSDSDKRLKPAKDTRREFGKKQDTFACRFYQGFARNSPCEGALRIWPLRIGLDDRLVSDAQGKPIADEKGRTRLSQPIAGKRFVAFMTGSESANASDAPVIRGKTNKDGELRLPVFDDVTTITLKIDALTTLVKPGSEPEAAEKTPEERFMLLTLRAGVLEQLDTEQADSPQTQLGLRQRLFNLGYGSDKDIKDWTPDDLRNAKAAFQRKHGLKSADEKDDPNRPDGPELTEATLKQLKLIHGS